jgi:hypothetical protein
MRAPRLLAAGTAAASLLLSGCGLEKPSPLVTVVSGSDFEDSEASSYCFEGQDPAKQPGEEGACAFDEHQPPVVRVTPGEQVGVNVAQEIAEGAWVVTLQPVGAQGEQQGQASAVQDDHYFAFSPQFQQGAPLELRVRMLESADPGAETTGIWRFIIAPR